ncbi:MAG TPA: glycerophosphodiester phosphodiesterase [Candidatus Microsaccharimonas sp.]|nr:glycerophosphodiester phosphodiesterase [Candidatus Microsaccharimonas sp.]
MHAAKPLIVGHRGAKGLAPENTLEGFEVAIQNGVDQIETDVRISKDGHAVIVHDKQLTTEDKKLLTVLDMTLPQLREHHGTMVTLEEAIDFVDRRVRLMIEVKKRVDTKPVIAIVQSFLDKGWQPSDFIFASFDFKVLRELRAALPAIDIVVLEVWSSVRAVSRARRLGTNYLSMDQSYLWWGVVRNLAKRYKLFTYPDQHVPFLPTNPTRPAKWAKYGLHGIITDYPDRFPN